jgi:hypothetical protein
MKDDEAERMSSIRFMLALLVVGSTGCAPTITIADGSAGAAGEDTSGGGTSGGSTPTGGTVGAPRGGAAGSATGGSSGAGNPLPDDCRRALPEVECNWRAALGARGQVGYCYKGGCHNAATAAGRLDLTTVNEDLSDDLFFIARLLNVPAKHEISCGATEPCVVDALGGSTCSDCATCVPGQVLVSTVAPGTGRLFDKLNAFIPGETLTTTSIGCGDAMPTYNTPGTANYTQAHKDCLIAFFTEIARTPGTWPCVQ